MREREQRVVRRRSRPARRRCWRARPGRRRGARPGGAAHARRSSARAAAANHAACAARRALGQPGLGHRLERERADAVEQPVAARRRRSRASGSRAARPRRSPPTRARRAPRARTRPPAAARRRRTWPAPTGPAGRRGTAARSSTRSSPSARGGARGLRLAGSLSTLKRSSRRRVISSIDSVLVRAAASSIASGRPSSERHSSSTSRRRSPARAARRVNSSTASASASGASSNTASPSTSSGDLAGAQDPQPGRGVEQADRERRGGVDDVLAVVEDHHRGGALEPLEQRRLAAGDVQRGDHRVEDVVGRRRGLEPGQPDAAGLGQRAAGRDRDAPSCRSRPARRSRRAARSRSSSASAAISASRPTSSADSDGRFPRRRGPRSAGSWLRICCSSSLQPRPGLEAELVGQPGPDALVGRQRVGLAARAVERGDQQLPQALLVRVRPPRPPPARRSRRLARAATAPRAGSRRASRAPPRAAPGAARPSRRPPAGPRRGSAPAPPRSARRRRARRRRRAARAAAAASRSTRSASTAAGSTREPVAAVAAGDHRRIPERPAQPGDLRLQRVAVRARRRAHRSSTSRSARTNTPASSARRTSSSDVLPPGTGTSRPSRRTSTGPSTEISNTARVYGRACQRSVSAALDGGAMRPEQLIHQLVVGDAAAIAAIVEASRTSDDPMILVAAALFAPDGDGLMARAGERWRRRPATASSWPSPPRTCAASASSSTPSPATTSSTTPTTSSSPGSPARATRPRSRHEPQAHRSRC